MGNVRAATRFDQEWEWSKIGKPVDRLEWLMTHGTLLFMAGSTQHHYRHSVPRQRDVASERLNLTFRRVLHPPHAAKPTGQRA